MLKSQEVTVGKFVGGVVVGGRVMGGLVVGGCVVGGVVEDCDVEVLVEGVPLERVVGVLPSIEQKS